MGRALGLLLLLGAPLSAGDLTISFAPASPKVGEPVTFTFAPPVSQSTDEVTFDFGDGATGKVVWNVDCALFGGCKQIRHTYLASGKFRVVATGKVQGRDAAGEVEVVVQAVPVPEDLYLLAAAHVRGANQTNWRTDLVVNNPTFFVSSYRLCLLRRGVANENPLCKSFSLPPGQSRKHADVVFSEFATEGAAALRLEANPTSILATSRTYNALEGGTYGQFVPVLGLAQALRAGEEGRLLQLSHDPSLAAGFRTNVGLINASPGEVTVRLRFFRGDGVFLGEHSQALKPFEYTQLDRVLEKVMGEAVDNFYIVVSCTPEGARIFAYASVVDNRTGDPILVPLQKVLTQP